MRLCHQYIEILQEGLAEAIAYKDGRFSRDQVPCDYLIRLIVLEIHQASLLVEQANNQSAVSANVAKRLAFISGGQSTAF